MGRILALDYGTKRCGIAVTDSMQMISTPLTTVAANELTAFIKQYIAKEKVDTIVVGRPLQANGSESEIEPMIKRCLQSLATVVADIPLERFDERYTSQQAMNALIQSGVKKMERRDKALIDKTSAAIILQAYMQWKEMR
jgi:putative Holliday junction resolvase